MQYYHVRGVKGWGLRAVDGGKRAPALAKMLNDIRLETLCDASNCDSVSQRPFLPSKSFSLPLFTFSHYHFVLAPFPAVSRRRPLAAYMPKKHQQRALQIKPQSSSSHTLSLSKSARAQHEASSQRSVNDLIRESRRLQLRNETRLPQTTDNAHSVPPSVRAVLDLPAPASPAPRIGHGSRSIGGGVSGSSPSRLRRIPGPPPPRSWLTDSIHAPPSLRSSRGNEGNHRIQVRSSNLPDGAFPPQRSLQHLVLKKIASNWEWHAENDSENFAYLPVRIREILLSYVAVYTDRIKSNPLRALLLHETDNEERNEVQRLDLSNALGHWTTFKQLDRDLLVKNIGQAARQKSANVLVPAESTRGSWDVDSDEEDSPTTPVSHIPETIYKFNNLKHLSLAISPANTKAASWSSLLSLAAELRTLTSLSLAYWPQPTFTPNAASTRAVIQSPGSRPVVYGGSDMYTGYDNNWREAAGILRTLSRSLYCLRWLDLTGCGDWFAALKWVPSPSSSPSPSPISGPPSPPKRGQLGPEWNGGWRGLEKLILEVGWKPAAPWVEEHRIFEPETSSWDVDNERQMYRYSKERERFGEIRSTAQSVTRHLRAVRRDGGGKWIDVELGDNLEPLVGPKWKT